MRKSLLYTLCVCLLALPWLSNAWKKRPEPPPQPKVYGANNTTQGEWLYVPILDSKGKVSAIQIMVRATNPIPDCLDADKDGSGCYPFLAVWCENGESTLMMMAPRIKGRFVKGENGPVHWYLDDRFKGVWENLFQLEDLSRMGNGPDSTGAPEPKTMIHSSQLRIEQVFENHESAFYTYPLKGFAKSYQKCTEITKKRVLLHEFFDIGE